MHDHAELELVSAVLKSLRYNSLIKKQHLKLKSELIDVNSANMKTTFEDGPATAVDGWKVRLRTSYWVSLSGQQTSPLHPLRFTSRVARAVKKQTLHI